jgi:hypothetical protein
MFAHYLGFLVTHQVKEQRIGVADGAIEVELAHSLGTIQGLDDTVELGVLAFLFSDVGGELDHLGGLAIGSEDRVVAGAQADFGPVTGDPLELPAEVITVAQLLPELRVLGRAGIVGPAEHRMGLSHNIVQLVPEQVEEVLVRHDDRAIEFKLDNRLYPVQRRVNGLQVRNVSHISRCFAHGVQSCSILASGVRSIAYLRWFAAPRTAEYPHPPGKNSCSGS